MKQVMFEMKPVYVKKEVQGSRTTWAYCNEAREGFELLEVFKDSRLFIKGESEREVKK